MTERDDLPTEPGTVIYIDLPEEYGRAAYILGRHGVWYPIAMADPDLHYLSSHAIREHEWEAA